MTRNLSFRTLKAGASTSPQPAEKPEPSVEALAIKKALGVPLVNRSAEDRQAYLDKQAVERALRYAKDGGNYGSGLVDDAIASMGIDRFLAAAPADVAAKMRAQIKEDRKREQRKAEQEALRNPPKPKPDPFANISGMEEWAIRATGTQAQIDALNARDAAQKAAAMPAATIRRSAAPMHAPKATKPAAMSQAEIDATWREAHERIARGN